jgi:TetR/AcrR family transcriptional regulator, transcriptional repressor of bet genes
VPKRVDHDERRRHIGAAVLRLIATRGLEAASLRNVAAEAGVSMGTVQHYFTTKQEMLDFAQRYNYERATVRIPRLVAQVPEPRTTRSLLRAVLIDLLGLDGESREGARLGAAMLAYAVIDPQAAATARIAYNGLTSFLATHLHAAQDNRELPVHLDPHQAARHLCAVVAGLCGPALIGACTPDQALAVLDDQLATLFGGAEMSSAQLAVPGGRSCSKNLEKTS